MGDVHSEWLRGIGGRFADVADELERYKLKLSEMEAQLAAVRNGADEAHREINKLRKCLIFFASVIKSGESWSETCEQEYRSAFGIDLRVY
jgi:hypothetical protein